MSTHGEMETEVSLPVRLEYAVDAEGNLEIVALVPLTDSLPGPVRLDFSALPARERRALLALARAEEARQRDGAALERRI